ncbi:MAG: type II toxin-antitoxin system RelE/ParE family toxin [Chitinophagaceae bacterium]|nr:type II toxin-antitoxin system RelE/ParE family toxin [Chitinophagaceae bacterium]
MKVEIRRSFKKAVKKLPPRVQPEVAEIISNIENPKNLREINNCKKMTGFKTVYRIKLQEYRIGLFYEKGNVELIPSNG